MSIRDRISLIFWQKAKRTKQIAKIFDNWWDYYEFLLLSIIKTIDPLTAPIKLVHLLGEQRGIVKLASEDEELFRKRVKFAFANAKDAGSIAGFEKIFKRLELGYITQRERVPNVDWDVIELELGNKQLTNNSELLQQLISLYGRTCRRYAFSKLETNKINVRSNIFTCSYNYAQAKTQIAINYIQGLPQNIEFKYTANKVESIKLDQGIINFNLSKVESVLPLKLKINSINKVEGVLPLKLKINSTNKMEAILI